MTTEPQASRSGPRALMLVSGGLDATLAARWLADAGWRLEGLHLRTGLELPDRERAVASAAGEMPVDTVDVAAGYLEQVARLADDAVTPGLCGRCRGFLLAWADREARRRGIEWLVTGEVVGQRAHGQTREDLLAVDVEAGTTGRVLRPLSGALLPPTIAEERALIRREELGRIHGRSRRAQFRLARRWGLSDYPVPSGACCRLEQPAFLPRLRDYLAHRTDDADPVSELKLMGVGRHFRTSWRAKVVFGRDEGESAAIAELSRADPARLTCQVAGGHGSLGIVGGVPGPDDVRRIAALAARFSRSRSEESVEVSWAGTGGPEPQHVVPASSIDVEEWRI